MKLCPNCKKKVLNHLEAELDDSMDYYCPKCDKGYYDSEVLIFK